MSAIAWNTHAVTFVVTRACGSQLVSEVISVAPGGTGQLRRSYDMRRKTHQRTEGNVVALLDFQDGTLCRTTDIGAQQFANPPCIQVNIIYIVDLLRRLIRSIAYRTTGRASGLFFGLAKPITQS